jgi:nucleoid DNA-binding protein
MNKRDLIEQLTDENRLSRLNSKKVVDLFFKSMAGALAQGDRVDPRTRRFYS